MTKTVYEPVVVVPNNKEDLETADGWYQELVDVKRFNLTEEQFEFLLNGNGFLFDLAELTDFFIDYLECARIEQANLSSALKLVNDYNINAKSDDEKKALKIIIDSLKYAIERETFWEIWCCPKGALDSFISYNFDSDNPVKRKSKKQ